MPEFKIDRFLDQFVAGSLVFVGTWYVHRPFLLEYFPNLAGDPGSGEAPDGLRLAVVLFVAGAICCGVILGHMSDLLTVAVFRDASESPKAERWVRRVFRFLALPVTIHTAPDPRLRAVERYLTSPRRNAFLALSRDWGMSDLSTSEQSAEMVLAHQHIIGRLTAHSDSARRYLEVAYAQVHFAATLALAWIVLIPAVGVSFVTSRLVVDTHAVLPNSVRLGLLLGTYLIAVLATYSYRRRFRHFTAITLTEALHFFRAGGEDADMG